MYIPFVGELFPSSFIGPVPVSLHLPVVPWPTYTIIHQPVLQCVGPLVASWASHWSTCGGLLWVGTCVLCTPRHGQPS